MRQLNPEYVQNFVNSSFALANSLKCVRRLPANRAERAWFLMFPLLEEIVELADGVEVEASQQMSMRIERTGFSKWSLLVKNNFEVVNSFDTEPIPLYVIDEQEGATNFFDIDPVPQTATRIIHRIEWNRQEILHNHKAIWSVNYQADQYESPEDKAAAFSRSLQCNPDLIIPEIDTIDITADDLDALRRSVQEHVQLVKSSAGLVSV